MTALQQLFGQPRPIIAMLHLPPLPGSPRYAGQPLEAILEQTLQQAQICQQGGIDGLMVENQGDLPFPRPEQVGFETVAAMSVIAAAVVRQSRLPVGINCLLNAAIPALAIAQASGAQFIRSSQWVNAYIGNSGLIEAAGPAALRYRSQIGAQLVRIFSDVHVKHGSHALVADRSLSELAHDSEWYLADVLIASGNRTGQATPVQQIEEIRQGSRLPVLVGSGLNADNARQVLAVADGAIVGTALKVDGQLDNPIDPDRVARLMEAVNRLRG